MSEALRLRQVVPRLGANRKTVGKLIRTGELPAFNVALNPAVGRLGECLNATWRSSSKSEPTKRHSRGDANEKPEQPLRNCFSRRSA